MSYKLEKNSIKSQTKHTKEENPIPPITNADIAKLQNVEKTIPIPSLDFSNVSQANFDPIGENVLKDVANRNDRRSRLNIGGVCNKDHPDIISPAQIQCLMKMLRLILVDYSSDCRIFYMNDKQKKQYVLDHIDPIIRLCDLNVDYGSIIRKVHMAVTTLYDIASVNRTMNNNVSSFKVDVKDFDIFENLCFEIFNKIQYIQNYEILGYL